MFIDIHCHLDICEDIPGIITRARQNKIGIIVTQGVNPESNRKALQLALKHKEVRVALGVYPIDALKMSDLEIEKEIEFIRSRKKDIVAIGEVGMDFKEDDKEHFRQEQIFTKFVKLSKELDKPVIIHSRKAEKECIEILEKLEARKVIMHCFCGKYSLIDRILANGWFITVPTNVTNSQQFQYVAKEIPLTHLFCETDSPFLHPNKERNNEPSLVLESYREIARLKMLPLEDIEAMIEKNYKKLFSN